MRAIRTTRTSPGLKLSELPVLSGVGYPHVSTVEQGIQSLTLRLASRLSPVLDVPSEERVAAHATLCKRLQAGPAGGTVTRKRPTITEVQVLLSKQPFAPAERRQRLTQLRPALDATIWSPVLATDSSSVPPQELKVAK